MPQRPFVTGMAFAAPILVFALFATPAFSQTSVLTPA